MAKIISIATAVPQHKHYQKDILAFMKAAYNVGEREAKVLNYLYTHSGIDSRYSIIPDFSLPLSEWQFFPHSLDLEPFPTLELRMEWYKRHAVKLSADAATKCISGVVEKEKVTHLITVSCTGMSAPGLELQLMEAMALRKNSYRTAVNFMGCYAAVHALRMACDIVEANDEAQVLVVCTELCSLHFQKTFTNDTIVAPLLFGDGSAAALICKDTFPAQGLALNSFYSEVLADHDSNMTWNLSSSGFVMTLADDVPDIFKKALPDMKKRALAKAGLQQEAVSQYCIHPGGKRILQSAASGLCIPVDAMKHSFEVLRQYGNMSSATILFVLKSMWNDLMQDKNGHTFAAAFGPGLSMESMILQTMGA